MLKYFILWIYTALWWISNFLLKPKALSCDKVFEIEAKRGRFNTEKYLSTKKRHFKLRSDFGYDLSCELLEPHSLDPENKVAILCHGFSYAKYGCLRFAEIYLKHGYKVLMYDHRNHGLSGKAYTTMGYFEKFDLKKVVDWCINTYGKECVIVTHGVSMGGATVLLHLGIDDRVSCAVADCAYSDLKGLLKYQMHQFYHLPSFIIPVESLIAFLRARFWFGNVSPIRVVQKTDTPVLFIHGKKDFYVPAYMSKKMYAKKPRNKAILLVAGAKHTESCVINRSAYEKVLIEFLKRYVRKQAI